MTFQERIKELRTDFKLSQEQLGNLMGISKVSVWQWENGRNYPKQEMAEKLCDYFNVSLDYLMGRSDVKNPTKEINKDDFTVAFYNISDKLSEDDKDFILKIAQQLAESKKK